MDIQLWIVLGCLILAAAFMANRIHRSVRKGGCNCECEKTCGKGVHLCTGGGECPSQKKLSEIQGKARP